MRQNAKVSFCVLPHCPSKPVMFPCHQESHVKFHNHSIDTSPCISQSQIFFLFRRTLCVSIAQQISILVITNQTTNFVFFLLNFYHTKTKNLLKKINETKKRNETIISFTTDFYDTFLYYNIFRY